MAIDYRIFNKHNLVYVRQTGRVTVEDHVLHFRALSKDPNYRSPMKKLVDITPCEIYDIDALGERKIAIEKEKYSFIFKDEQCAIVVSKPWIYGMNRIFEAVSSESHFRTHVFQDIQEAIQWLNIPISVDEFKLF